MAALTRLPALDTLLLRGAGITDDAVPSLAALPRLRQLALTETSVSKEAVATLQKALPSCRISRINTSELLGGFGFSL